MTDKARNRWILWSYRLIPTWIVLQIAGIGFHAYKGNVVGAVCSAIALTCVTGSFVFVFAIRSTMRKVKQNFPDIQLPDL